MQNYLKSIRLAIAIAVILLTTFVFIDVSGLVTEKISDMVLFLQFVPSFLNFLEITSMAAIGFIVVLLLTLLFGRVYCSYLCPLGILQDVFIRISRLFKNKRKRRFKFKKAHNIVRFSILGIVVIYFVAFNAFALNLLDPYSVFGKIVSDLFRPVYALANNTLVAILESINIYAIYPVDLKGVNALTLIFPSLMLILIVALSVLRGRLYCNTVCPVGAFLGLLSKVSLFRISIDKTGCTKCGKCIAACKAECINIKDQTVDFSRCVGCENCIKVCETNDISYKLAFAGKKAEKPAKTDDSKRDFFQKTTIYLAGLLGISETIKAQNKKPGKTANGHQEIHQSNHLIPVVKENPVAPPGSLSIEHMKEKCTACHLCVSVCPMHVLKPSFLEYGFTGMLIPHMDYETHYCNYECTLCTEVCPTGSILKISTEEKKTIQMGIVKFIEDNCIVKTENTACGSCSEHCPTQAVTMVPYKDGLTIPTTKESICIGCGACEYACPVRPHRAIYVKSNPEHLTAKIPKTEKLKENLEEDFPF